MRLLFGPTTVTTAGTRVQLSNTANKVRRIQFAARAANTGRMFIGDSSVSATASGWELTTEVAARAKGTLVLDFGNGSVLLSVFYVDSTVNAEILDWVAVVE